LEVNHWIDQRRDPELSTHAAARYLKDLHREFGDWALAMAAYNGGPGKIKKAIRLGKTRNYWDLSRTKRLGQETGHYVGKVMGASLAARAMFYEGFSPILPEDGKLPSQAIYLPFPVRLGDLAKKLDTEVKDIRRWNPAILRDIVPPDSGGKVAPLRVDSELANRFNAFHGEGRIDLTPVRVASMQLYRVVRGDTLERIARRFGIPGRIILAANRSLTPHRLAIGETIAVPVPAVVDHP
jgi:membrane-bound lytic murein transglycosylase D